MKVNRVKVVCQLPGNVCVANWLQKTLEKNVQGTVAEFGVLAGFTTAQMAKLLHQHNRNLHAFDAFTGLPYSEGELEKGECYAPRKSVEDRLKESNLNNVVIVEGLVEDTLPEFQDHEFAFSFLDLDLQKSTQFVTDFVAPRTVFGGVMAFHDYRFPHCPGIEIVVDDLLSKGEFRLLDLDDITIVLEKL